jgi:clan AA aspartic protease (TIGR02281 family)
VSRDTSWNPSKTRIQGLGSPPRRAGRVISPWFLTLALSSLLGIVLFVVWAPDVADAPARPARRGSGGALEESRTALSVDVRPRALDEETSRRADTDPRSDDAETVLELADLRRIIQSTLVVLELQGEDERPLRDVYGLLVDARGGVLTRVRDLLGARSGTCRLPGPAQDRVGVLGVAFVDVERDIAIVRTERLPPDRGGSERAAIRIATGSIGENVSAGDELVIFATYQPARARVEISPWIAADGIEVARLETSANVSRAALTAIDTQGRLIGLCRFASAAGGNWDADARSGAGLVESEPVEIGPVEIVPVDSAADAIHLPIAETLFQLTERLWTGSFADLFERGEKAFTQSHWTLAIELFVRAVDRQDVDVAPPAAREAVRDRLREAYLQEISRLVTSRLFSRAAEVGEAAVAVLPQEPPLWSILAEAHSQEGAWREAIRALVELYALDPSPMVERRLERSHVELAQREVARGDERSAEAVLLEGLSRLPNSGWMTLELGKLYHGWELYDDAVASYQRARELDVSLSGQIDVLLQKISDVLARRDALVLPMRPGSQLIEARAVLDGRVEHDFVIDTGATHTTVSHQFAASLGYDLERAERVELRTAGGSITGRKITVRVLDLQGYSVQNLEVVVLPPTVPLPNGLLGLNFLRYFRYQVDAGRGEFRLERQ